MGLPNSYYLQFAKNIYTQNGEDGIIEQLLKDLNIEDGIVVEFGAWNGVNISNVINLWMNKNFNAILIEPEPRYNELQSICGKIDKVECLNHFVNPDPNHLDCLDNILDRSKFEIDNNNLVLVSIDVDTCDYNIFESMIKYSPKIVLIETNTDHGPNVNYISQHNGSSLKSITDLAESKGYRLVCHTGNAFYVRLDLFDKLPQKDYSLENLFISTKNVEEVMQRKGPDGNNCGSFYYLSDEYNKFVSEIKYELTKG